MLAVLVIVSIAAALMAVGVVVVAGFQVARAARALVAVGSAAGERLGELTEELQAETAVTQLEVEALSQRREAR